MSPEIGLDLLFNDLVQDIAQYIKKEACHYPYSLKNVLCLVKLTANSSILGKARHGIALSGGTLEAL